MVLHKRKRTPVPSDPESESDVASSADGFGNLSDDEIDISSALTEKRPKLNTHHEGVTEDDEDDLEDIIRKATSKANVKGGTEMLKKTKGKSKIVKGEVGGGSFQSMGAYNQIAYFRCYCNMFFF